MSECLPGHLHWSRFQFVSLQGEDERNEPEPWLAKMIPGQIDSIHVYWIEHGYTSRDRIDWAYRKRGCLPGQIDLSTSAGKGVAICHVTESDIPSKQVSPRSDWQCHPILEWAWLYATWQNWAYRMSECLQGQIDSVQVCWNGRGYMSRDRIGPTEWASASQVRLTVSSYAGFGVAIINNVTECDLPSEQMPPMSDWQCQPLLEWAWLYNITWQNWTYQVSRCLPCQIDSVNLCWNGRGYIISRDRIGPTEWAGASHVRLTVSTSAGMGGSFFSRSGLRM